MRTSLTACLLALAIVACEGENGAQPGAANGAAARENVARDPTAAQSPRPDPDLLTLAEGAVVLSASANAPAALALTDGAPRIPWQNEGRRDPLPYTFVFELRAPTRVRQVGIAGAGERPGGIQGGSARGVTVEASSEGPETGYRQIASLEAAPDGETLVPVAAGAPIRWLRFTVSSNHGSGIWTYIGEAIVRGEQALPDPALGFAGVYRTGPRDFVELKQEGGAITGCYSSQGGTDRGSLSGEAEKGVARLGWRSDEGVTGTALFVIDSRRRLNGVRYRDRSRAAWAGGAAPAGTVTQCSAAPGPANPIAAALEADGRALIYGIRFDFDQAVLKPESAPALERLLAALQGNSGLRLTIEGHTDADGADDYNLRLSADRARAVVGWLVARGVDSGRLEPAGRGETRPVADNATADGRALNRRVEAVRR